MASQNPPPKKDMDILVVGEKFFKKLQKKIQILL